MAVKTSSSSHFTSTFTEGASDTISTVSGRYDVKMNALGLYGILNIDFLFSKIIGFAKNKKDVIPTPPHGLKDKGILKGTEASTDSLRSCCRDRRNPDPFEPGGSGRLPKQPFQPLACAPFSSWAFPLPELAPASSPPAPQPLAEPWLWLSPAKGVRGNYRITFLF